MTKKEIVINELNTDPEQRDADIARKAGSSREFISYVREVLGLPPRRVMLKVKGEEERRKREERKASMIQRVKEMYPSEWGAYANAKQRCTNSKNAKWKDYGGRGIQFLFKDFREFMSDIGPKPWPGLTLDRIENNGHYEKGNVRWTTQKQQCNNRRPRKSTKSS